MCIRDSCNHDQILIVNDKEMITMKDYFGCFEKADLCMLGLLRNCKGGTVDSAVAAVFEKSRLQCLDFFDRFQTYSEKPSGHKKKKNSKRKEKTERAE